MAKKDKRKRESDAVMSRRDKRKRSSSPGRDWAALPEGVIDCIADMVLAEDVTEYIHLRGVCASWRRATPNPAITNPRFRPRNWILVSKWDDMILMFAAASSTTQGRRPRKLPKCRFLNLSTGNLIRAHVREVSSIASGNPHFQFLSVADGLLALLNDASGVLHLLNPFTGAVLRLPPLPPLFCLKSVNFAPSSSSTIVVSGPNQLAHAKPGDTKWSFTSGKQLPLIQSFQDQLYSLCLRGELLHLDLDQNRFTTLYPSLPTPTCSYRSFYSVASDGEMLVVCLYSDLHLLQVFKIDFESRKLIPKKSIGDRALFFRSGRKAFSVSTSIFPSLIPNSIYYSPVFNGEGTCVYHPFDCRCHPQKKNYLRKAGMYHEIPGSFVESSCWVEVNTISSNHDHVSPSGYASHLNLYCRMY